MIDLSEAGKQAYSKDGMQKKIIIHFPYGEHADISNDQIVAGSFKFTERLCSQDSLKFGLCEGNELEFTAVGIGNIKGKTIDVLLRPALYDESAEAWIGDVSLGRFTVTKAERSTKSHSGTTTRKISAVSMTVAERETSGIKKIKLNHIASSNTSTSNYDMIYDAIGEIGQVDYGVANSNFTLTETAHASTFIDDDDGSEIHDPYGERIYWGKSVRIDGHSYWVYAEVDLCAVTAATRNNSLFYITKDFDYSAENEFNSKVEELLEGLDVPHPSFSDLWEYISGCHIMYVTNVYQSSVSYDKYDGTWLKNNSFAYPYMTLSAADSTAKIATAGLITHVRGVRFSLYRDNVIFPYKAAIVYRNENLDDVHIYSVSAPLPSYKITLTRIKGAYGGYAINQNLFPDVSETMESVCELMGMFGRFSRKDGTFSLKSISDTTPCATVSKSQYANAWFGDNLTKLYSAVCCTYTSTASGNPTCFAKCEIIGSNDDQKYQVYDISDNAIIAACKFSDADMKTILQRIADKIQMVRYMPFESKGIGLPYIEAGDYVNIETDDGWVNTIILQRTMSGIQTLTDAWQADGEPIEGDGSGGTESEESYQVEQVDQIVGGNYDNYEGQGF